MAKDPSFNWTKEQRRAAARKAGAPRMSLAQLERANVKKFQPYFTHGPDSVYLGQNPSGAAMQQVLEDAGSPRLMQQSKGRMAQKLLKGGGSIRLPQMGKQSLSQLGLPGFNMEKGAGFNLGKIGGMKALLPLLLIGLLAGVMGGGNEDLDEKLG